MVIMRERNARQARKGRSQRSLPYRSHIHKGTGVIVPPLGGGIRGGG